jgi:hypothetical protein
MQVLERLHPMTSLITPQSPTEIASAFVEAITAGDTDTMAALMTDDFVWRMLPATLGALARNKREYLLQTAELGRIFAWLKVRRPQSSLG